MSLERIYEKAALCRAFEEECERRIKAGDVKCPVYLSTGQEYIAATVATWCEDHKLSPQIFVQHRAHSIYLAFGGDVDDLVRQILFGMEGSNCIQSKEHPTLFGHDAMLGSQVPIAVGACYGTRKPTLCFLGDAAAEEDYALAALGWAATQRLPILFVVEDNNLSILTKKQVRRSWDVKAVARGFGLIASDLIDIPWYLLGGVPAVSSWPALLNVHTTRLRWHSGSGTDGSAFDRHTEISKQFHPGEVAKVHLQAEQRVKEAWAKHYVK